MNLLCLIARELTRRSESPDGEISPGITDADRVKALEAFLARVRSGNLSADDQLCADSLAVFVQRVTGRERCEAIIP